MMWWIRQHLTLMLCLSVIVLLRTSSTFQGHMGSMPTLKFPQRSIENRLKSVPMKDIVRSKKKVSPIVKIHVVPVPMLKSLTRQYQYIFSGRVNCPEAGCAKTVVQMNMQTPNNTIERTVPVEVDGSYQFKVSLHELPHGQVDWTLSAQHEQLQTQEVGSHQILMDDQVVMVERELAF